CDPVAVAAALGADPLLAPLVARWPGLRVPGHVDGAELAVRAVVGQQVSVAGARTVLARLVQRYGEPLPAGTAGSGPLVGSGRAPARPGSSAGGIGDEPLTHLFPSPDVLATLDPADLPMPRARGRALVGLATALADGSLALDRGPDRARTRAALLALPGIGDWTASYIAIRALGDPDAFMPTDLGTRHALTGLGADPAQAARLAEAWRPWRSYAQSLLWATLLDPKETP
ncbi:MAG: AlkA N-terminal domain-containing protein, partial [Propionicimonas sp.]|nr:hypothetical protein [Propionicimonas sp.]